jgi:hypothetical protein
LESRRTLRALPFMTVLPSVTCPSPPSTTVSFRRTARIVVEWGSNVWFMQLCSTAAFGTRVRLIVCAGQVLEIKVGIDLRRGDVGMPQQFLYAAQITTGFK